MSELINERVSIHKFRRDLLATAAMAGLLAAGCNPIEALAADDTDRPTVWIELGGQLERADEAREGYAPPFTLISPVPGTYLPVSPSHVQKPSIFSYGAEGKVLFQPEGTNWVFSAAVRYGRSNNSKHVHQQSVETAQVPARLVNPTATVPYFTVTYPKFADFKASNNESHTILDFQAGKDIGLGIFERHVPSTLEFGIRIAEFSTKSHVGLMARPDVQFYGVHFGNKYFPNVAKRHIDYSATSDNSRDFHGIGPSLSWNASAPFLGNPESGEVTFDWGIGAAVLFGRQKANGHHQQTARYYRQKYTSNVPPYGVETLYQDAANHNRSRTVVVPNVGGLAGLSVKYSNAKISFGYRADFYFGAMDGGIDSHKSENVGFYGPFATISIGLGG